MKGDRKWSLLEMCDEATADTPRQQLEIMKENSLGRLFFPQAGVDCQMTSNVAQNWQTRITASRLYTFSLISLAYLSRLIQSRER